MAISFKHVALQTKTDGGTGVFEGMLSPYGNVDSGGDMVLPGAYTKTLRDQGNIRPMLWQHKTDVPIGQLVLEDRADGLWCKGTLLLALPEAQKAYTLVKNGIIKGLSIGFEAVRELMQNNVRLLAEIKLYEGSVVTFPMNEQALIASVKSADYRAALSRVEQTVEKTKEAQLIAAIDRLRECVRKGTEECQARSAYWLDQAAKIRAIRSTRN